MIDNVKPLTFEQICPNWAAFFRENEMEGRWVKDEVYTRSMVYSRKDIVAEAHGFKDYDCKDCAEFSFNFYEHPGDFEELKTNFVDHWNEVHIKKPIRRIEKKVWIPYYDAILHGTKNFDLRLGDFDYQVGDILVLREWSNETKKYTGRKLEKEITYVLKTKDVPFWSYSEIKDHGFTVLSFKPHKEL